MFKALDVVNMIVILNYFLYFHRTFVYVFLYKMDFHYLFIRGVH